MRILVNVTRTTRAHSGPVTFDSQTTYLPMPWGMLGIHSEFRYAAPDLSYPPRNSSLSQKSSQANGPPESTENNPTQVTQMPHLRKPPFLETGSAENSKAKFIKVHRHKHSHEVDIGEGNIASNSSRKPTNRSRSTNVMSNNA